MKKSLTLSRRKFIQTTAMASLGLNIIGCRKSARKPNLLFLWTDEQRADTMKVYGNDKIHAPNLNKLTEESIVFGNTYVSQPVCTPSRSTVMTGLWPHSNGCIRNNIPLPAQIPCLPEMIDDPDYRTGYYGKWHLGDEVFSQHGFEEWESIEDIYADHFSPGKDRNAKSSYCYYLLELGYQPDGERGEFSRQFTSGLPLEHCKPKFLEMKACDFLRRHRKEPFILYVNFLEPHMPFTGPLNDEHPPDSISLPLNFDDLLDEDEPLRYRLLREQFFQQGHKGFNLKTEDDWRRLIANYWGLVTQVDLSVGAILKALEDLGLADDTLVCYTSDHGDMMGSHRLLAKTVMYEEAVKVPWLIRIPQRRRTQQLIRQRVSQIDLLPTMLHLMGKELNGNLQGRSLLPLLTEHAVHEDHVFIEWNAAPKDGDQLMGIIPSVSSEDVRRAVSAQIRTVISPDGWKLCLSDTDKSQLYNLNDDPRETTNLFYSGHYDDIIDRLKQRIVDWQEKTGDTERTTHD